MKLHVTFSFRRSVLRFSHPIAKDVHSAVKSCNFYMTNINSRCPISHVISWLYHWLHTLSILHTQFTLWMCMKNAATTCSHIYCNIQRLFCAFNPICVWNCSGVLQLPARKSCTCSLPDNLPKCWNCFNAHQKRAAAAAHGAYTTQNIYTRVDESIWNISEVYEGYCIRIQWEILSRSGMRRIPCGNVF